MVNRLWGNPNHLWHLKASLLEKYANEKLHILVAKRNTGSFTYDGIETGGERVTTEIEETLQKLEEQDEKITKISIIGYSLGGLVARYCVGLLHSRGWFDRLQPINFTTFATPHLGVRTPLLGWHNHIWNVIGARTLSASGRQLFMFDNFRSTGRPLLSILADENSTFISGLRMFKNRTLYSNIVNDRSVPFYTSYIARHDPFVDMHAIKMNYLPDYAPVILDPAEPVSRKPSLPSLNERLAGDARTLYKRLPFFAFFIMFHPIGPLLFLLVSVVQSVKSSQRIRLHEEGKLGVQRGAYRSLPLFINDIKRAAESAFENLNVEQELEYLPGPGEEEEDKKDEFPTLALTPEQFKAIDVLDKLNWKKYAVHIQRVNHTHAAIIVRMNRKTFEEGGVVVKHWVENFDG